MPPTVDQGRWPASRHTGCAASVGVPGLFATAYGNVGSSIYYALGLVAAHALGLTPLVFMFAGGLFVLTAKTYAEGAVDVPRGGRLLLVRAPRLQRASSRSSPAGR